MSVEDLRELRAENEKLNASLKDAQQAKAVPIVGGGFDWESQKQRLLAQLESDFDDGDEAQAKNKLTVEGAIRITDQVVAQKDQLVAERELEIQELKQLLDQQAGSIGDVAVGAAAIADMLDKDELVREERENLVKRRKSGARNSARPRSKSRWNAPNWPVSEPNSKINSTC